MGYAPSVCVVGGAIVSIANDESVSNGCDGGWARHKSHPNGADDEINFHIIVHPGVGWVIDGG